MKIRVLMGFVNLVQLQLDRCYFMHDINCFMFIEQIVRVLDEARFDKYMLMTSPHDIHGK